MTSTTQLTPLRYDSPTVTLEVMARRAAISQWSDKPVVQVLRYQLQVRDLSGALAPIDVSGDRTSFFPLMETVQNYVQGQLTGDRQPLAIVPRQPYLEPRGLTQHTLHLGPHRTTTGQSSLILGAVQLADLAQVLDQLDDTVRPLPISVAAAQSRRPWQQWGAAAAGLVAAVGVTTALWPNYQSQQRLETAQEAPSLEQEITPSSPQSELEPRSPQTDLAPETATEADSAAPSAAPRPDTAVSANAPRLPESNGPLADNRARTKDAASDLATPAPTTATPPTATSPATANPQPGSAAESTQPSTAYAPDPTDQPRLPEPPRSPGATTAPLPSSQPDSPDRDGASASIAADAAPEALSTEERQSAVASPEVDSLVALVQLVRDRWMPPANLEQTLAYTLVFAADGTLIEVIPKDNLAAAYRQQTGIPAVGTVSLPPGEPQRVLLRLKPSGEVEFEETELE